MSEFADRLDGISTSVAVKAPVRVATLGAITLSGPQTIDGVSLVVGNRVLVKNQADPKTNGIYDVNNGVWLRSKDFDGARDAVLGTLVYVGEGSFNGDTYYRCASANPVLFGSSDITFTFATLGAAVVAAAQAAAATATAAASTATTAAAQASTNAILAEYYANLAGQIANGSRITPLGSTLPLPRTLAEHLSNGGRVFHSKDFSGIDHTGATDSLSGVQKLLNKGGDPANHTYIILDAGALKIGNAVPQMAVVTGAITINSIVYNGTANSVRVNLASANSLASTTVINAIATGSSFLTVEGAANDQNNGRFTISGIPSGLGTGNASNNTFTWSNWTLVDPADIYVTVAGVAKTNGVEFNIDTGSVGNPLGGSITFTGGNTPANGALVVILVGKYMLISTARTDTSLDETGLNLTTAANRLRVAGMEPLYMRDNSTIIINCDMQHYINSGQQHLMCFYNIATDGGYTTYDVRVDMKGGGRVVFPALGTPSPSKKGIAFTYGERFRMEGYNSTGDDRGSFDFQIRNCSYGHITGNTQRSGNSTGEDGVHAIKTCRYVTLSDLVVNSGDDSVSFTQESSAVPYVIEQIVVTNCVLRTAQNSSFKCFLDSTAAAGGAIIKNIAVSNCIFGVHDNTGVGTLLRVSSVTGFENNINNITFSNCVTENIGDGTGALNSTSCRFDYVSDCQMSNCILTNGVRNQIVINGSKRVVIQNNIIGKGAPQTSVSDVSGTVTTITQITGTTFEAQFSGTPDFSTTGTTFTTITIAGALVTGNNGTFEVVTVNNTLKTIRYTISSKYATTGNNETGLTAASYVRKQPGEFISLAGGDGHQIKGNTFIGSYLDANSKTVSATNGIVVKTNSTTTEVPINHRISNNHFIGFQVAACMFLTNGQYFMVEGNTATGNTCRNFILEGSNCLGSSYYINNIEYGSIQTPIAFFFSQATSFHRGNISSSNADTVTGSITIPNGSTSVTISIPDYYTAPTGASPAIGWSQGFNLSDPKARNLTLWPTTSYGSAKQERVTYTGGSRIFTITLDTNPGADVSWDYALSMANDF